MSMKIKSDSKKILECFVEKKKDRWVKYSLNLLFDYWKVPHLKCYIGDPSAVH